MDDRHSKARKRFQTAHHRPKEAQAAAMTQGPWLAISLGWIVEGMSAKAELGSHDRCGCYCQFSGELRGPFGNCYVAHIVAIQSENLLIDGMEAAFALYVGSPHEAHVAAG
jgi:hypothetical protein